MAETSLLIGLGVLVVLGLAAVIVLLLRPRAPVADPAAEQRLVALNARLDGMASWLQNAHGQLQQTVQVSQSQFQQTVNERLDAVTARLGESLTVSTNTTAEHLQNLHARLAVIDSAQKNITDLASQVTSLRDVLANKQARGAFGQMRMETIVKDGLPKGAYTFQATLSNGKRPDCLLHMPNASASVVIDAKFPLEGFEAFRTARRDDEKKEAARRVRVDVARHVDAMAERYFIPGETQDTAILFVPSEAIYAELHESFEDLVQRAYRARIVLTSPNMLMLAVQTMQAILKDVKMREQAHLIQREVVHLMEDTGRLRERVLDLQRHFGQANADIEKILTSSERIGARGRKIEALEFEEAAPTPAIEQTNGTAVTPSEAPLSPTEGLERRRNGGARIVRQA